MQMSIKTIILSAAPPLLSALIVGVIVSVLQTITSINEQTLASIPKMLVVFLSLIMFGSYITSNVTELFNTLYGNLVYYVK
ncbi:MAG: flagellar biosynthetic protein FliQ [bacterium]